MSAHDLSDEQYLVLDLLMRARQKGVGAINRIELMNSPSVPAEVKLKLTWAALTMPKELLTWSSQHDFMITEPGIAVYNLRFAARAGAGATPPVPSTIADGIICLPGPDHDWTAQ